MLRDESVASVAKAMDEAPFGSFHLRVIVLIIAGLFFDLFDVSVLGSLAPDLIQSGFATPADIAVVASCTFLGLLLGSVLQGEMTDRFGRKVVYQANLLIYGIATVGAALSPNYVVLSTLRFIAGLGLGAEIPLAYAYAAEFSPRSSRGRVMACLNGFGGCLPLPLAVLFALAFRDAIGWRGILIAIGIGALIVFIFRMSLPESPRWLVAKGRTKEAFDILSSMGLCVREQAHYASVSPVVRIDPILFVLTAYTRRTVVLMTALFAAFAALFALVTWMPTLMGSRGFDIVKSLKFTLVMACAFPMSSLFLALLIDRIGRVRITIGSFILAGISALFYASVNGDTMVLLVGFLMSFFVIGAANAIEILCGEIFPTDARSSGSGLVFGAGRVGAILASYFVPAIMSSFGVGGVYVVIACLLAVGGLSMLMLGLEPAQVALEDIAPTISVTVKSPAKVEN